jgi:HEAT repeat protein
VSAIRLALIAALLLAGTPRAAPEDAGLRARVDGLLGSFRPVSVEQWRSLGSEAAPVLESIARDGRALPTRRARALAALGVLRPSAARPLVKELASDRTAPPVLRSAAVDAAPSVLGTESVSFLAPFLHDGDAAVRRRSAEALAATGPTGCRVVLKEPQPASASDPLARTRAGCTEQLRTSPSSER